MAAGLLVLVGLVVAVSALVALGWYVSLAGDRASARHLARLQQLQAERRIQQITMAAVQELLDAARTRGER